MYCTTISLITRALVTPDSYAGISQETQEDFRCEHANPAT